LSWLPNNRWLASASLDGTVRLWEVTGGDGRVLEGPRCVTAVAFSPDRKHLASAGSDRAVWVWSLEGGECLVQRGHREAVVAVAWSPDGKWVASAGDDLEIRLWEPGQQEARLLGQHLRPVSRRELLQEMDGLLRRLEAWEGWTSEAAN
jgi:WD40 repeat protein